MNNNQLLQVKQSLDEAISKKKLSQELLKNLGSAVIDILRPVLDEISKNAKLSKEELLSVLSQIKIDAPKVDVPKAEVKVTIPDIVVPEAEIKVIIPDIVVPEPKVTVNVPPFPKIPEIKIPKIVVPKPEVTVNVPPIKIPDLQWPKDKMPIEGWVQLMGVSLQNPLPVQIRDANGKPVDFAGNITQVMGGGGGKHDYFIIKGYSQSAFAELMNADGRLKVSTEIDLDIRDLDFAQDDVSIYQVSGHRWSVEATQSGIWNITTVTGITNSVAASLVDSSGVQYSGSNPLPIGVITVPTVTTTHSITGIGHGVKTVTTAGTDEALAGSTACKKVTIQAQTDNTGLIAVGASGVDATEATGTGIILYAGDVFEFEIDNLADIFIDATVNGEGVRYSYFI